MNWHKIVRTEHSWDAADSGVWDIPGQISAPAGPRLGLLPDRGESPNPCDIYPDKGVWAQIAFSDPSGSVPGPLVVESDPAFGGLPSLVFDYLGYSFDGWLTGPAHSFMTSADVDGTNRFANGAGYPQPTWVAALVVVPILNGGIVDSIEGGLTVNVDKPTGKFATTTEFGDLWPKINFPALDTRTILFIEAMKGDTSYVDITWRDASNQVQIFQEQFALDDQAGEETYRMVHFGGHMTCRLARFKLGLGEPNQGQINKLRRNCLPYIPPTI